MGRFIQADSIIPNIGNPQSFDRYAYVLNSPIRYNDPTGHIICESRTDLGCSDDATTEEIRAALAYEYDWIIDFDFSRKELEILYKVGNDIYDKVNSTTQGKGYEWMHQYLDNVSFVHGGLPGNNSFTLVSIIHLTNGWEDSYKPYEHIAHELGHIFDDNTAKSNSCAPTWCGGGAGDKLTKLVGGNPKGLRFMNGTSNIPKNAQWIYPTYGNHSTADYFAESFRSIIYDSSQLPQQMLLYWMKAVITLEVNPLQ